MCSPRFWERGEEEEKWIDLFYSPCFPLLKAHEYAILAHSYSGTHARETTVKHKEGRENTMSQTQQHYAPPLVPIRIPVEDTLVHTQARPFCSDATCPCHEDETLIRAVAGAIEDGVLTPDEASRYVQGLQL